MFAINFELFFYYYVLLFLCSLLLIFFFDRGWVFILIFVLYAKYVFFSFQYMLLVYFFFLLLDVRSLCFFAFEGTFKFKQQWGAQPVLLNWFLPGQQPSPTEIQTKPSALRKIVEKIWPQLPLGLTTFIGPKIRKYVSL